MHRRNLKRALNHRLVLEKFLGVVKLNQTAWLKPYIDMNFDRDFFKLMNSAAFGKTMKNMKKKIDILNFS